MKLRLIRTMLVGLTFAVSGTALADDAFPSKQIQVVVPFGPGSGTDLIARVVAERLERQMKVPIVVGNREGAGGIIGTSHVVKAPADGYTMVMASNAITIAPHLYAQPPYNPETDLIPVTNVATMPLALVTSTANEYDTLDKLFDYIKANPGKVNFASSGKGAQSHLEVEALLRKLDLDAVHVPYKNTGIAATDLMSDRVTFYMPALPAVAGHVQAGKLRVLAIGADERSPTAPDAPTFAEALGDPKIKPHAWFGFMVPAGTPQAVVSKLNDEIVEAMKSEDVQQRIRNLKADIQVVETEDYQAQVKRESAQWRSLVEELGLQN